MKQLYRELNNNNNIKFRSASPVVHRHGIGRPTLLQFFVVHNSAFNREIFVNRLIEQNVD